jgi:hypothetical protein
LTGVIATKSGSEAAWSVASKTKEKDQSIPCEGCTGCLDKELLRIVHYTVGKARGSGKVLTRLLGDIIN